MTPHPSYIHPIQGVHLHPGITELYVVMEMVSEWHTSASSMKVSICFEYMDIECMSI